MDEQSFTSIESVGRTSLIEQITELCSYSSDAVISGVGDDAAVIDETGDRAGLLTSETFLEGIDFDLTYTPLHHLGYKSVSAAVSDLLAMNGKPEAILINLGLPNKLSVGMVKQIYKGIDAAGNDFGVQLAGGDLTASHNILSVSVTAYGRVQKKRLTYRKGAKVDDAICVTGDLGGAMAGLRILMREKSFWEEHQNEQFQPDLGDYEYVVKRQLVPVARKDVVKAFSEQEILPTSMIDLSKGVVNDLEQLIRASGVGARIYGAALPVAIETRQVADEIKEDVDKYALYGGEDYEMLFTLPEEKVEPFAEAFNDFVVIGKIVPEEEGYAMQPPTGGEIRFDEEQE